MPSISLYYPDVVLEMGGYDIEQELFEPLNGLLNRCKSAKTLSRSVPFHVSRLLIIDLLSRKMIKRLEDLAHSSSAVKSHLVPQMKDLNNYVAELVNFGISVSQRCLPRSPT